MAKHADAAGQELNGTSGAAGQPETDETEVRVEEPTSRIWVAVTVGVATILALSGLTGWLSYQTSQAHEAQQQRNRIVELAREFAVNLTTIDYTRVEADIQRIMDSSIGHFHDDFQRRSQPFVDIVKKAQSKSRGTVTAAGLESQDGDHAQTLIAVSGMTSTSAAPQQPLRAWRMRIDVQTAGQAGKVSGVEFVP